jgi:hypothetical protein
MSTTPTTITSDDEEGALLRLREFFGAAFFLLVRRSPRLLRLHRNQKSWALFRVVLGLFGAALVVLPLSLWTGWITAIFGMLFFVASILLPPAQVESDTDRKARELGAKTVVSGGIYQPGNAPAAEVQLFISSAHIWALDEHLEPLLVINAAEVSDLRIETDQDNWMLRLRWADHKAEFEFEGFFAERFARLAYDSICGVVQSSNSAPSHKTLAAGA